MFLTEQGIQRSEQGNAYPSGMTKIIVYSTQCPILSRLIEGTLIGVSRKRYRTIPYASSVFHPVSALLHVSAFTCRARSQLMLQHAATVVLGRWRSYPLWLAGRRRAWPFPRPSRRAISRSGARRRPRNR